MSLFGKKESPTIGPEKLQKEIALQIEMNQELKQNNEQLKKELLHQQKELARFEENLRKNPASQLMILHNELRALSANIEEVINGDEEMYAHLVAISKDICTDAFELLNKLKEIDAK